MRHISFIKFGGDSAISSMRSFHPPAALCGIPEGGLWKPNIPPMLAAQAAFPSGPLAGIH